MKKCDYCAVCTTPFYQNKVEMTDNGTLMTTIREIQKTQAFCRLMKQLKEVKVSNG